MLVNFGREFNETYNIKRSEVPTTGNGDDHELLFNIVDEELNELDEALYEGNIIETADALGDAIYALLQQGDRLGFPMMEILTEIHRSNMSKLGEDGEPIIRNDGKILKGPNFSAPDIAGVLLEHRGFVVNG